MAFDLLVKGGHVVDPSQQINGLRDVALNGGKVAAVQQNIPATEAKEVVIQESKMNRDIIIIDEKADEISILDESNYKNIWYIKSDASRRNYLKEIFYLLRS